jgi:hypothetical protein
MLICNKHDICPTSDSCRHGKPHEQRTFKKSYRWVSSDTHDCSAPCAGNGICEEELVVAMKEAIKYADMDNNNPNNNI